MTTSFGDGFLNEINKHFPEYETTKYSNLENTELIDKIYNSVKKGKPMTVEFAAIYEENGTKTWTLHFGLVTGVNVPNDSITVINPYGYVENYTIEEFLSSTRYDSYENMEFYFKLGFMVDLFTKNTIYIMD